MNCPTCGRAPSERSHCETTADYGYPGCDSINCDDPIHDLADQAPTLRSDLERAREALREARSVIAYMDRVIEGEFGAGPYVPDPVLAKIDAVLGAPITPEAWDEHRDKLKTWKQGPD